MTDENGDGATKTDETGSDAAAPDERGDSWWSIEGETTGERVRDGLPQLAIIVVLVWLGTSVAYNVLSAALDPITATASIVLGSLYVGLRLRRWLTVDDGEKAGRTDDGEKAGETNDGDARDETTNDDDAEDDATDAEDARDGAVGADPNGDAAAK